MAEFSTSNMMGGLEDMEQQQGFKPMMEGMKPEGMKPKGMELPTQMNGGKKRKRKTKRKTAKKGGKRYKRKTAKKSGKKKRSGKKKH